MRNEIRSFSELTIFCDLSPVCCLNVGSAGHVLGCLACADSWLCVVSVHSLRASECSWLCDATRAVGAGVLLQLFLSPYFLLQKLSTLCSFHFIRCPPITPQQHKWLIRPSYTSQLAEGTCTAAVCHSQPKQHSQDSDWQGSQRVNILAQLYSVLRYDLPFHLPASSFWPFQSWHILWAQSSFLDRWCKCYSQLVSPRVVVRLLFACLLRANIRRGWKGNF